MHNQTRYFKPMERQWKVTHVVSGIYVGPPVHEEYH
jgi:hypothetical protein